MSLPRKGRANLYLNLLKQAGAPLARGLSGLHLKDGSQHKTSEYYSPGINIGSVLVLDQHHRPQEATNQILAR